MKEEKRCFKCGEIKPLAAFYAHKGMKDGHVNKCKDCNKNDVHDNRIKNIEYYREYDRSRGNRQGYDYTKNYRNSHPMKYAAHILVGNAVRDGRLLKPSKCEDCNTTNGSLHGHHDDYAIPLSVRWLCSACHKAWHLKYGEAKNSA